MDTPAEILAANRRKKNSRLKPGRSPVISCGQRKTHLVGCRPLVKSRSLMSLPSSRSGSGSPETSRKEQPEVDRLTQLLTVLGQQSGEQYERARKGIAKRGSINQEDKRDRHLFDDNIVTVKQVSGKLLELLHIYGFDINMPVQLRSGYLIHDIALSGQRSALQYLTRQIGMEGVNFTLESRSPDGRTPILWAAQNSSKNVLCLATYGANVNAVDHHGNGIFHIAAKHCQADVIELLLGEDFQYKSVPLEVTNGIAKNPLHVLCESCAWKEPAKTKAFHAMVKVAPHMLYDNDNDAKRPVDYAEVAEIEDSSDIKLRNQFSTMVRQYMDRNQHVQQVARKKPPTICKMGAFNF